MVRAFPVQRYRIEPFVAIYEPLYNPYSGGAMTRQKTVFVEYYSRLLGLEAGIIILVTPTSA